MNGPVIAVIPTRDRRDLVLPLIEELAAQDQYDQLIVLDNGNRVVQQDLIIDQHWPRIRTLPADGLTIYEMWNWGWYMAMAYAFNDGWSMVDIAFLNDDIQIPDKFLGHLSNALRSDERWWCVYPNYDRLLISGYEDLGITATKGTYREGGMWGCAFMLRGEKMRQGLPMFDEQFQLWYGDDDLVRNIGLAGGEVGRVEGLPLLHHGSATTGLHPELDVVKGEDEERYRKKVSLSAR